MKRLHVNVAVNDLTNSVRFYIELFAQQPSVLKTDYAKWMLDDPRVNFSLSQRGRAAGVDHLGIQVDSREELDAVYARLERAEGPVIVEGETTCCYAVSEKSWIADPQGVQWEAFFTTGDSPVYGTDEITPASEKSSTASCRAPTCCSSSAA